MGGGDRGRAERWPARAVGAPERRRGAPAFGALIDLLDGIDTEALAGLPAPQRAALDAALLRAEPSGAAAEPQAIALGLLNAMRAVAGGGRLLVAIDDVQWLDRPSADALAFAERRLEGEAIGFLLARRPGRRSVLERALERVALERMEVGPLTLEATRRLLSERLGLSVPRRLLRRIVDTTLGNPLFALELGRPLALSTLVCTGAATTLTLGGVALGELHPGDVSAAGFEPVVTVGLAFLVFGESLGPVPLAGGALVLAAVLAVRARPVAVAVA